VNRRQRSGLAIIGISAGIVCACVVERPVANESSARGRRAHLFALDCRAWPEDDSALDSAGNPLAIEMTASLVDFGGGDSPYTIAWVVDGTDVEVTTGLRPTATGAPLLYRKVFSFRHVFARAGLHTLGASVLNGERKATCTSTVRVGEADERAR
jgi:hypothetical protein